MTNKMLGKVEGAICADSVSPKGCAGEDSELSEDGVSEPAP